MAMTAAVNALSSLANTREFVEAVKALTLSEAVEAYLVSYATEEVGKNRRDAIRLRLLDAAIADGVPNDKGGHRLDVEGHTVVRERRVASSPDEKKLFALLEKSGLKVEDAFDKVTVLQPNPSKLSALVDNGVLAEEDVKALYRESIACFVSPNGEMEELLENALPVGAVEKKRTRR